MASLLEELKKRGNLNAVLKSAGNLVMEEGPLPHLKKGDVLLGIKSVGICGSDIHWWMDGKNGIFVMKSPMVLGHEASGVVLIAGEDVTHLKAGDRVAIESGKPCRVCSFCKEGRYNLCPRVEFGCCLTRYYSHPADFCYKLPDNVSFDEGALLEPLSVAVHACQRAEIKPGSKVLVCGAGPIGLLCMLTAKVCGASDIIVIDINQDRLKVAKEMGASYTVTVTTRDGHALAKEIEATLGCQPDNTIECSGVESSIATAIYATRSGGILMLVGMGAAEVKIPIMDATLREVDIRGMFRYVSGCYATAMDLVASGKINIKPLITHFYKLEETLEALKRAKTGEGGAIKVMIRCAKDAAS